MEFAWLVWGGAGESLAVPPHSVFGGNRGETAGSAFEQTAYIS